MRSASALCSAPIRSNSARLVVLVDHMGTISTLMGFIYTHLPQSQQSPDSHWISVPHTFLPTKSKMMMISPRARTVRTARRLTSSHSLTLFAQNAAKNSSVYVHAASLRTKSVVVRLCSASASVSGSDGSGSDSGSGG